MLVRWPGVVAPGGRHRRANSLIDLIATMLDIAGADRAHTDGTSLAPLSRGEQEDGEGLAIAEFEGPGTNTPGRMVRQGRHKLNYYHEEPVELFDLDWRRTRASTTTWPPTRSTPRSWPNSPTSR